MRQDLGVQDGEYLVLERRASSSARASRCLIELVCRLGVKARLVISHAAGDEGTAYEKRVHEFAELLGVPISFEAAQVGDTRALTPDGRKVYTLGDVYPQADLVTYPSTIEGFGNAFLEAVYYRRPLVVNNYSIYEVDIKPEGLPRRGVRRLHQRLDSQRRPTRVARPRPGRCLGQRKLRPGQTVLLL